VISPRAARTASDDERENDFARLDDPEEPTGFQRPDPVVIPGREHGDDHAENDIAPVAGMTGQVKDRPAAKPAAMTAQIMPQITRNGVIFIGSAASL
jgi:hypothetical protein